jgi:UDP-N-acetylmuramyl pentapeptide phosphotransferase/UDP-N-acetylglucosamine-1-phosphate transferase
LLFNFDPARVFLGDAGSIPLGFLAGALGLWGWQTAAWPLWFPLLVFSPFIVDATVTLLRRALRGKKVWQAHHDHAYQRLVRSGWSHRRLAWAAYLLMAACVLSALVLRFSDKHWVMASLALWGLLYAVILLVVEYRWRQAQK